MSGGQDRQSVLGAAIDRGRYMDIGLVVQQLGGVPVCETGISPDANTIRRGQDTGGQFVHDPGLRLARRQFFK